jgi:branched-chain amino acid transport system permease protein
VLIIGWILRTPFGVALRGLRDSEDATIARGVGRTRARVTIFVVSASLTGLAGAYYAYQTTVITPSVLSLSLLVQLLAMIIIGGTSSSAGVLAGTALLVWLDDRLATEGNLSALLFGAIILLVVLVLPGGIAGTARRLSERASGRLDAMFVEDGDEDEDEQNRDVETRGHDEVTERVSR